MASLGVTWGIGTREELSTAGADRLIATPAELPSAAAVLLEH
jgi:phosphoglycolate phosphatase